MSFNKIKAMKNAERYLTQGKIQAAINEYQQVVENEPKDINSRNMLGDLYVKADDTQAAMNCYREVAEHYNSQGFAKKAIAIYNKIYRIEPDSLEVSTKLAELYRVRGSMAEAKKHYQELAKRYESKGHKIEALEIWEKIAEISPKDTEIYIKIADVYWQENRKDEAAKAFYEAGTRFAENEKHEAAVTAFSRSLEVNPEDLQAIRGVVKSQIALGYPEDAATIIEKALATDPHHKEFNYLLMDCYFDMGSLEKAESLIVSLVEREPASYMKFMDLVNVYLENDNLDSSIRILSMTSEHLLVGGESEVLLETINEVLARNPEHIPALRLLARYHGWNRDEDELKQTLERLVESAYLNDQVEDEKYALSQYILLVPHDVKATDRLKELNQSLGIQHNDHSSERLLSADSNEIPTFESFATLSDSDDSTSENGFEIKQQDEILDATELNEDNGEEFVHEVKSSEVNIVEESADNVAIDSGFNEVENDSIHQTNSEEIHNTEDSIHKTNVDEPIIEENTFDKATIEDDVADEVTDAKLSPSEEIRIEEEIESIKFYIEQGYTGLAEKSLSELEKEFGNREEIVALRNQLPNSGSNLAEDETSEVKEVAPQKVKKEQVEENAGENTENVESFVTENIVAETVEDIEKAVQSEDELESEISEKSVHEDVEVEESTNELVKEEKPVETVAEQVTSEETETSEPVNSFETEASDELIEEERVYTNSFESLKDELGLDKEEEEAEQDEFEEHYQHAVVYQEMGMLEEAIREFQGAVKFVNANDGTSRHMNCCTLIGHCFIQKGMPHLSIPWFEKGFEKTNLESQEKLGLFYEIANAYEANGDKMKAIEQFETIYSLDVDYRDVGKRLQVLNEEMLTHA